MNRASTSEPAGDPVPTQTCPRAYVPSDTDATRCPLILPMIVSPLHVNSMRFGSLVAHNRIFPAAERFGMGVVVATPLERGILATGVADLGEHYARRFSPEVLAQVENMETVCQQHGVSILAAALQFVTRHPVVATTIPGPRSPEEARQNALVGAEPIPDSLWEALQPLIKTWEIVQR